MVGRGWKLDLAHCIRLGVFRPGAQVGGSMNWTRTRTGTVTADISYDYRVQLETTRPNYGGLRWWFRAHHWAPRTGAAPA